jgi:phage terminase large subunit GpA-like protein
MSILVDPRALALTAIEIATRPPPPADLNAWAEANIVFGRESPFPGAYRRETIPPVARILECLGPNHPARTVTVKASAQIFKTTVAQIFIAGSMDFDPCDMGYVHPTHDNALRWARRKWKVMRKQSLTLRRIFGDAKSRDSHDTTLYQETRDGLGSLTISGANSPASLSMASWPKQVQDDLSKWEANDAGDPERQSDSRSAAFDWAKLFKISTPLRGKTCRISRAYRNGTQERWHVPCPSCGHMQPLEWKNFQASIDRDAAGKGALHLCRTAASSSTRTRAAWSRRGAGSRTIRRRRSQASTSGAPMPRPATGNRSRGNGCKSRAIRKASRRSSTTCSGSNMRAPTRRRPGRTSATAPTVPTNTTTRFPTRRPMSAAESIREDCWSAPASTARATGRGALQGVR